MNPVADVTLVGREPSSRRDRLDRFTNVLVLEPGSTQPDRLVQALSRTSDYVEVHLRHGRANGILSRVTDSTRWQDHESRRETETISARTREKRKQLTSPVNVPVESAMIQRDV